MKSGSRPSRTLRLNLRSETVRLLAQGALDEARGGMLTNACTGPLCQTTSVETAGSTPCPSAFVGHPCP